MIGSWLRLYSTVFKSASNQLGNFMLRITCLSSHWLVQCLTWEDDRIWFPFVKLSESYSPDGNRAFKLIYLVHMGLSEKRPGAVLVLDKTRCIQFQNRPVTAQCWIFKRCWWHLYDNIYIRNCKEPCAAAMREEWEKNGRGTALQTSRLEARKGRRCLSAKGEIPLQPKDKTT